MNYLEDIITRMKAHNAEVAAVLKKHGRSGKVSFEEVTKAQQANPDFIVDFYAATGGYPENGAAFNWQSVVGGVLSGAGSAFSGNSLTEQSAAAIAAENNYQLEMAKASQKQQMTKYIVMGVGALFVVLLVLYFILKQK